MELVRIITLLVVALNVVTFAVYGIDKWKAQHKKWRIPEAVLLLLAFFGGAIGAILGMRVFHHKTHHKTFAYLVPIFLILHISLIFWIVTRLD